MADDEPRPRRPAQPTGPAGSEAAADDESAPHETEAAEAAGSAGEATDAGEADDTDRPGAADETGSTGDTGRPDETGDTGDTEDTDRRDAEEETGGTGDANPPDEAGDTGETGRSDEAGDTGEAGDTIRRDAADDAGGTGEAVDTGETSDTGDANSPDETGGTSETSDFGDTGGGGAGDGAASRRGRVRRWAVPAVLAVLSVAAAVGAVSAGRTSAAASAVGAGEVTTPVLSARRAPELVAAGAADRRLAGDLEAWVAQSPPDTCLVVTSDDRALFAHNATAALPGASTQKVVTGAALLLALGEDARLETAVRASAPPARGVIAGDLYLVGGGDPLWTSPGYALARRHPPTLAIDPVRLVDAVVEAGVTRIEGGVVGDGSRYDTARFHPSWPTRFHGTEAGPIGALTVNDGRAGADGMSRPPAGPAGADPALNAASVVTDLLRLRGVTVVGAPRAGRAPSGLVDVAAVASAPVGDIVAEMLTDSDDDTAEMALKELGRHEEGAGTWEAGAAAATAVLDDAGVGLDGVRIVDGSGLSSENRLTCQLLVDLLSLPETEAAIADGLAVAGETGTLQDRWDDTAVEGRLRAKTGTLNAVTALAGHVSPRQGGELTFAYVATVADGRVLDPGVPALQGELGEVLVDYPRAVDLADIDPEPPTSTP